MIRTLALACLAALLAACTITPHSSPAAVAAAPATHPPQGRYIAYETKAEGLPDQQVTIWLPPGYERAHDHRYPVLYMWDGQNLFDPDKTMYHKAWMVQDVLGDMVAAGTAQPHIVVGIASPPGLDRYRVYVPQFAENAKGALAADIARMAGGDIASKAQLEWVANTLKPQIDARYRTRPEPADTTIVGASMGGVMACYAAIERPDVFGRAGCVSAHLALADPEIAPAHAAEIEQLWSDYLDSHLKRPGGQRLWIDHGTVGLDGYYGPWQDMLARQLTKRGWQAGRDFTAQVFEGAEHDEIFWNRRMPEMLQWLWRKG